jgi:hypothetical protein
MRPWRQSWQRTSSSQQRGQNNRFHYRTTRQQHDTGIGVKDERSHVTLEISRDKRFVTVSTQGIPSFYLQTRAWMYVGADLLALTPSEATLYSLKA